MVQCVVFLLLYDSLVFGKAVFVVIFLHDLFGAHTHSHHRETYAYWLRTPRPQHVTKCARSLCPCDGCLRANRRTSYLHYKRWPCVCLFYFNLFSFNDTDSESTFPRQQTNTESKERERNSEKSGKRVYLVVHITRKCFFLLISTCKHHKFDQENAEKVAAYKVKKTKFTDKQCPINEIMYDDERKLSRRWNFKKGIAEHM